MANNNRLIETKIKVPVSGVRPSGTLGKAGEILHRVTRERGPANRVGDWRLECSTTEKRLNPKVQTEDFPVELPHAHPLSQFYIVISTKQQDKR